ncbi:unnamed protein product [Schistosoma haematobium]|nr:unnamed protein product [Schistosoma haematobium]
MDIAFELACEALKCNEVPVGCAFVYNGEVIASGRNEVNATRDATQHAEMVTIRRLEQWCRNNEKELDKVLTECDLFVTVEPCIMCTAAIRFCLPAHLRRTSKTQACDVVVLSNWAFLCCHRLFVVNKYLQIHTGKKQQVEVFSLK